MAGGAGVSRGGAFPDRLGDLAPGGDAGPTPPRAARIPGASVTIPVQADDFSDLSLPERPLRDPIDLSGAEAGEAVRVPGAAGRRGDLRVLRA